METPPASINGATFCYAIGCAIYFPPEPLIAPIYFKTPPVSLATHYVRIYGGALRLHYSDKWDNLIKRKGGFGWNRSSLSSLIKLVLPGDRAIPITTIVDPGFSPDRPEAARWSKDHGFIQFVGSKIPYYRRIG